MRPQILVLLVLALLAVPSSALAQSAGDDQYRDPLAPQGGGGGGSSGGGGGDSSQRQTVEGSDDSEAAAATSQPSAAQANSELPRTGAPTSALALAGTLLLGGGVALRRVALYRRF